MYFGQSRSRPRSWSNSGPGRSLILKHEIGIDGTAFKWFESFISGRCQKVKLGVFESIEIVIKFGVPQGSVLGPVLFNIYIRSLYHTVHLRKFYVHGFADDHQIYKNFLPCNEYRIMVEELPSCFADIDKWMTEHYLKLNPDKTEIIVFGKQSVLSRLEINGVFINSSTCVRLVSTVKSLGFRLDSNLTLNKQIAHLKTVCFHKLRNIAKMRYFLTNHQIQILVQALVISSLDYCNALYYGINSNQLKQLQMIQNRACKTIIGLKRRDHVAEHMEHLHWLRIQQRIEFKILLIVFKSLNGLAPSYISELLKYNDISGSRTPSLKPYISKTMYGGRAFVSAAPTLWNNLPIEIKQCDKLDIFKKRLKTFLFRKSYNLL